MVDGAFRLVQKRNPKKCLETRRERFLLGRSQECDLIVPEPHVSRLQAKVWVENGRHFIKNLGRNPIRINGSPTAGDFLKPGDEITLGKTRFLYQPAPPLAAGTGPEAPTLLAEGPVETICGERLVCTSPSGLTTIHVLTGRQCIIGRSQEADIILEDPAVSRRHCVIDARPDGYHVRNISAANPLSVNDEVVTEKRLRSGDRLGIGPYVVVFLSDRSDETAQPARARRRHRPALWALALCMSLFAGYTVYQRLVIPWQAEQALAEVAHRIEAGDHAGAREALLGMLSGGLPEAEVPAARKLLNTATVALCRETVRTSGVEAAASYLKMHLAEHGSGPDSAELQEELSGYRLELARRQESAGDPPAALRSYAAIPEASRHFPEAQKAVHRLWLDFQWQQAQQQTVAQLLREAEEHFTARRYLTPVHRNAYSAFQAVLALEPQNETALRRIDQIKSYYRSEGESHFKDGNWPKALAYFERYALIDPEALDIREKITDCHRRLAQPADAGGGEPKVRPGPDPVQTDDREKIRQMLEESGAESSWIMKYLFQERSGEAGSETPW
jgi:pSer/pThr/pTyr-binding forkhead associated (FHA) protein/tetratricopeptide (TPR) repeat protein